MTNSSPAIRRGVGVAVLLAAALAAAVFVLVRRPAVVVTVIEPPGNRDSARIDGDTAILVNGRRVSPTGRVVRTQSYNWGMAVRRDEGTVALVNPSAIQLVDLDGRHEPIRVPPFGEKPARELGVGSYMGCAFSPDGRLLYFGSADTGEIKVLDVEARRVVATIAIDGDGYRDSFVGAFVLTSDGTRIHAVDQFNYRLVVIDTLARRVVRSVRVGRNPFAVALSPDERHAWVSNVGMFEYPRIPGVTPDNRRHAGLSFPAYGVPSPEAERGTVAEGIQVPGLGSVNHPDAMSVFRVNLRDRSGRPAGQDRLPGRRPSRRDPDRRRRQPRLCRRRPLPRLRLQRDQRHHHGARRVDRVHGGPYRAHGTRPRDAAGRAPVRRCARARRVQAVRRLRGAQRRGRRRHAWQPGRGLHPGRLVRRARRGLARRASPSRLERQGARLGAERRRRVPGAWPRPASGRHHAGHAAGGGRPRCRRARPADRGGRREHVRRQPRAGRSHAPGAPRAGDTAQPDPARRLRGQGEPHVRPGVRPARRRERRPGRHDARSRDAGIEPGHRRDHRARGRVAQPSRARRPVRDERQLLLRRRPVEHRPSLGRGRVPERVGRGQRPVEDRGDDLQRGAGASLRGRQQRGRAA